MTALKSKTERETQSCWTSSLCVLFQFPRVYQLCVQQKGFTLSKSIVSKLILEFETLYFSTYPSMTFFFGGAPWDFFLI